MCMIQDLQGKFFEEGDIVAYVGFDYKIKIGKAIIKDDKLVLELENKLGYSKLDNKCLIIY